MRLNGTNVLIQTALRTSFVIIAIWFITMLGLSFAATGSLTDVYETEADYAEYEAVMELTTATRIINGRVEGLDTLGGIIDNELAVLVGFAIPLLGVSLMSRFTRKEEESGRLELLMASRVGWAAPLTAATIVTVATVGIVSGTFGIAMRSVDVDTVQTVHFVCSVFGLGMFFAGVTAVTAQIFEHSRSVFFAGLGATILSYVLRGYGAVEESWVMWITPHGWSERCAPFGENPRWWPLWLLLGVTVALIIAAYVLAANRDVGGAYLRSSGGAMKASALLQHPIGTALYRHRTPIIIWTAIGSTLMGLYGSMIGTILDALEETPELMAFYGGDSGDMLFPVISSLLLMQTIVTVGFVLQTFGAVRDEERSNRLELVLSGAITRSRWLLAHLGIVMTGATIVGGVSTVVFAMTAAATTGDETLLPEILQAVAPRYVVVVAFAAAWVALYGARPSWLPAMWVLFGTTAVLGHMGPVLSIDQRVLDANPMRMIGDTPAEDPNMVAVWILVVASIVLITVGTVGLSRRDVPSGK